LNNIFTMGLQSTTKNLNYSIEGDKVNSVNATIVSSPGFNGRYLGKLPGILKLLSLILSIISLALIASLREDMRLQVFHKDSEYGVVPLNGNLTYQKELFLSGEVYFLCAHTALLTILTCFLLAYLFHTVSSMVVPKASIVEPVLWMVLAFIIMTAGILEIVMAETWKQDPAYPENRLMTYHQEAIRDAAGALAIINAIILFVLYGMAKKEYDGPHQGMGGNLSNLQ